MNANTQLTTGPLHRDPDQTIDRALSALRNATPRSGNEIFAGRILASLEHRATAQPTRFHLSAHLALWTATSAAIIAIASLAIFHHHTASTELARTSQTSPGLAAGFSPLNTSTNSRGALAPARTTPTVSSRPKRVAPSGETCISNHPECSNHADDASSITPSDAQALADLHAPSHPAPPLPLTPQEKLFLHVLRYGNLTQLAELNPLVRAQQDAAETADFKTFFPDPPPLQQSNGDTE